MGWQLTEDPTAFTAHARPLLARDPVGCTVGLTQLGRLLRGDAPTSALLWHEDGGAVSLTPPGDLVLSAVPPGTEADLVAGLAAHAVPGLHGEPAVAAAVAGAFGRPYRVAMEQPLYRLAELVPPPRPAGRARPGTRDDEPLLADWWGEFQREAAPDPPADRAVREAVVAGLVRDGLVHVWTDEAGLPVAMASRTHLDAGAIRVSGVYTPDGSRGRGYAAAVTHVVSEAALAAGAEHVLLFTDGANATTNALYPRLGYRRAGLKHVLRF